MIGVGVLLFLISQATHTGDFRIFIEASNFLKNGESPYNKWIFISKDHYYLYFYSPFWALILVPFTFLPSFFTNLIWLLLNVLFLVRLKNILVQYIELSSMSIYQLKWVLFLTALMSIRFILYNFQMVQMTIFLLWGALESIRLIKKGENVWGGMLMAFIINIKILPIVLLPYLFYRGYFKGTASTILFSALFILLPSLYLGWSENLALLTDWWSVINPMNTEHLFESELGPHSLTALIPSLLIEGPGSLDYKRNILSIGFENAAIVLNVVRLSLVLSVLYFLKWPPFTKARSIKHELWEISYILLLIPLIFPHQQKYAFAFAIPACFYMSHFVVRFFKQGVPGCSKSKFITIAFMLGASIILATVSTDGIIGRELNNISQHYKTITWGMILLLITLYAVSPETSDA